MANTYLNHAHYALLIGVDAYLEKPLKGCVRDVQEIKKHLDCVPKPGVQTHMLTASLAKGLTSSRTIEELMHWPTYRNVVDTMNQITCRATEGDFVYVHFSGHGTAFRPPPQSSSSGAFSNPTTGDLALNLLQEDGCKVHYLRGSELAYLVKAMVDRKLIVTLVLDCCFSGSVMRDDSSVRYLDYNLQVDGTYPKIPARSFGSEDKIRVSAYRRASLYPNWLANPDGYTVITACGPTEVAKEIKVGGQVHGALSYHLADTFEKFGGIGGKQHHIYQYMRARFQNAREESLHNQNPMLYGNKDLYFLGRLNPRIGPVPLLVIKKPNGGFHIDAGQAHGVCKGDRFAVCPIGSTCLMVSQGHSATAEIISVGNLTSNLKLSVNTFTSDTTLVATSLTNLSLQRFPIRLNLNSSNTEALTKALNAQQTLCIHDVCDKSQERPYSFTMAMLHPGSYKIQDKRDRTLLCLPASSIESDENVAHVLETLQHLTKFELVKSLTNDSFCPPQNRFRKSFSVHIIGPAGGEIDPGCLQTGQQQQICSHQECLIEVEDGTSLLLRVKNRDEGGCALCVHVYSMGFSWDVDNILRGDYEVIPPPLSNQSQEFRKGSSGIWSKRLKMTVPSLAKAKDATHCDDIIKVFLTSQPTSFLSLELPELGEFKERRNSSEQRVTGKYSPLEDWVALSFRIRTSLKRA